MATKKKAAAEAATKGKAKAADTKTKKGSNLKPKAASTKMSDEEKAAKRAERMEALKNRPAIQRTNSKQVDVIELEGGGKVVTYAYPVRKMGVVITAISIDAEGNVTGTSVTTLPGYKVKCKKGHGMLVPGVAGLGKGASADDSDADSDDDDDSDED